MPIVPWNIFSFMFSGFNCLAYIFILAWKGVHTRLSVIKRCSFINGLIKHFILDFVCKIHSWLHQGFSHTFTSKT